jgi:hypothetical protein
MKTIEKCPFCKHTQRLHKCNHWLEMRGHFRARHPNEMAELLKLESQIANMKNDGAKRFGAAFGYLLV